MTNKYILKDLVDVIAPLPTTKRERYKAELKAAKQTATLAEETKSGQQPSHQKTKTLGASQNFSALEIAHDATGGKEATTTRHGERPSAASGNLSFRPLQAEPPAGAAPDDKHQN